MVTGAMGFVWLCSGWSSTIRRIRTGGCGRRRCRESSPQSRQDESAAPDWRASSACASCYTLILARFFTDPVMYFVIFWLPEYLRKERGFDLAMVGKYAWVPFIFGDIGYMLGGWLSGQLMRRMDAAASSKVRDAAGRLLHARGDLRALVPDAWMAIAATCFVTFAWLINALRYVPPAVLTAIIVPAVLIPTGEGVNFSYTNAYLVGAVAAFGISWFSQNLLLTIVLGMAAFWGWQWLVGLIG